LRGWQTQSVPKNPHWEQSSWRRPHPGYLGGLVAEQPVMIREPDVVAYISHVSAYPNGFLFTAFIEQASEEGPARNAESQIAVASRITGRGRSTRTRQANAWFPAGASLRAVPGGSPGAGSNGFRLCRLATSWLSRSPSARWKDRQSSMALPSSMHPARQLTCGRHHRARVTAVAAKRQRAVRVGRMTGRQWRTRPPPPAVGMARTGIRSCRSGPC
jgi:hypothetical protein